jgi:Iron/manganese superoxide dismutases, C-terminal domain
MKTITMRACRCVEDNIRFNYVKRGKQIQSNRRPLWFAGNLGTGLPPYRIVSWRRIRLIILNYNYRDNTVHNHWAWDHTHSLTWKVPLLVMGMYEHAYAIDYGANARGYIDAFSKILTGPTSTAAPSPCGGAKQTTTRFVGGILQTTRSLYDAEIIPRSIGFVRRRSARSRSYSH